MRRVTVVALVVAALVGASACGTTPTSPQARQASGQPAYDGGGYMGSGD